MAVVSRVVSRDVRSEFCSGDVEEEGERLIDVMMD